MSLVSQQPVLESVGATPASEFDSRGCAPAIPLHGRGGAIRAYTIVDLEDYEWVSQRRWSLDRDGYAVGKEPRQNGRQPSVRLHRKIVGLPRSDSREVDHINRDRLDNRRCNLRIVTRAQNAQNYSVRRGSSRFRGVCWNKTRGKWMARGRAGGKFHNLGEFDTEQEAADAAAKFREHHMPFATD